MAIKDPTAWKDDLTFYMTEQAVAEQAEAIEPALAQGGSKVAASAWFALVGVLGALFGAVTASPGIRHPIPFAVYVLVTAVLLRGLHPLTVRFFDRTSAFIAMFGFFWTFALGLLVMFSAGLDSRWWAYGVSVGGGAFIGMMYGSFPPSVIRSQDAWGLAFLVAPAAACATTYFLRHTNWPTALAAAGAGGVMAGVLFTIPMAVLMVRLWDASEGLAELAQLYLHNHTFSPKAVAYLDRAIALRPDNPRYYTLRGVGLSRMGETERAQADWDKATSLAPRDSEPDVQRGVDCIRRGADADAVRPFESALEKNPRHGRAHCYLAGVLERLGDPTQAFDHYDKAVALAKDDAWVHCARSYARLRGGDSAQALGDAKRAVRLDSHNGLAYAALGNAFAALGRVEEARESYSEAIDLGVEPSVHQDVLRRMELLAGSSEESGQA